MSGSRAENLYGKMLDAVREWMHVEHPEYDYVVLVAEQGEDQPSITIPIIQPVYQTS